MGQGKLFRFGRDVNENVVPRRHCVKPSQTVIALTIGLRGVPLHLFAYRVQRRLY